jgi:hypothetical protein
MTTAQDVLTVARRYLGTKESPPHTNKQIFGEWYGWNGVPWCAIFVSYCFYEARLPLPYEIQQNKKGFAYCPYGVNYYRNQGKFDKKPQEGDLVFFDWQKDGISDHVGIVEKVVSPTQVICIEGNTSYQDNSNGGEVMRRTRYLDTIQGFAHPDYDGNSTINHNSLIPTWPNVYIRLTSPLQKGEYIREWQQQMVNLGYNLGSIDGIFGPKCHEALIKFQSDRRLEPDGVLGPITWNETWKNI